VHPGADRRGLGDRRTRERRGRPLDYAVQAFFVGHRETSRTVAILVPAWMEIAAAGR
jgi:hypothetical protein